MLTRRSATAADGDRAGSTPLAPKGHHHHKQRQPQQTQQPKHLSIPESEGKGGARTQGDAKHKGTGCGFMGVKPLLLGAVM